MWLLKNGFIERKQNNNQKMKISRLIKYVKRYTNRDITELVTTALNESDIRIVAEDDAIDIAYQILNSKCDNSEIVSTIMTHFMEHEVRRNRMHPLNMSVYLIRHTHTCYSCIDNQPNQLAHMDFGGCLYTAENEFW